jgi:cellulose synthase/poly-beta-1,6-N-acetylglucosamine synthase-like glycosyltransferase
MTTMSLPPSVGLGYQLSLRGRGQHPVGCQHASEHYHPDLNEARYLPTAVASARRIRAAALNRGAAEASGDVFLFLDADTPVPRGYDRTIRRALADPRVVGGAFEFALDGTQLALRLVELLNRVRYRIWPLYYGDQGLFVRASAFRLVWGYREQRLL